MNRMPDTAIFSKIMLKSIVMVLRIFRKKDTQLFQLRKLQSLNPLSGCLFLFQSSNNLKFVKTLRIRPVVEIMYIHISFFITELLHVLQQLCKFSFFAIHCFQQEFPRFKLDCCSGRYLYRCTGFWVTCQTRVLLSWY